MLSSLTAAGGRLCARVQRRFNRPSLEASRPSGQAASHRRQHDSRSRSLSQADDKPQAHQPNAATIFGGACSNSIITPFSLIERTALRHRPPSVERA